MKKLICTLLVLALVCTCAFGVFAEDEGEEENLIEIESVTFKAAVEGDVEESVRGGGTDNTAEHQELSKTLCHFVNPF